MTSVSQRAWTDVPADPPLDAVAVDIDANAVRFSFVEGEQVTPTVVVAAYGTDGALLDSISFVAGEQSGPVRLSAPDGAEIVRVNASSVDGVVTLHGLTVLAAEGGVEPTPEPEPATGNPLCSLLPFLC